MKLLILTVVVFAATNVLAQNPYEYIDDGLLDKVAKIVYDYDQKVAASRSAGGAGTSSSSQVYQSQQVQRNGVYGQDYNRQGRVSNNFNNANANYRRENNYGVQQQQGVRSQRQYNYGRQQTYVQPQQQQNYIRPQQQQTYVQPRAQREQTYVQQQQPRVQPYVAVAPMTYQEPQVVQRQQQQAKSGFTYSYNQPEVAQRVAEFHFTEDNNQRSFDSAGATNVESNKYRLV